MDTIATAVPATRYYSWATGAHKATAMNVGRREVNHEYELETLKESNNKKIVAGHFVQDKQRVP